MAMMKIFQNLQKKVCTNNLFYLSHSSYILASIFISKVNFVTLAQIVSENQHQKKPFLWRVIPEKSDPRAIVCLSKQLQTNSRGLS